MKRKIIFLIKTIIGSFLLWVILSTVVENIYIRSKVNEFKKMGVYQEELSTDNFKFYKVYDANEKESAFTIKDNKMYPGVMGDYIVGLSSPFPNTLIDPFLTFFVGGHAALCAGEYTDQNNIISFIDCIEATGDETINNGNASNEDRSYWYDASYRRQAIGLRVKTTDKIKEKAFNNAVSYIGDPYNSSFLFNTNNTKYCTDLISKAYLDEGINLNKDGLAVTVLDLIFNDDTYLFYYHYIDQNNVVHIYYRSSI